MNTKFIQVKHRAAEEPGSCFAKVIDRAPLPIAEVRGSAHLLIYANRAFCSLFAREPSELIGLPFTDVVPGGPNCIPVLDRVFQTGEPASYEQELATDPDDSPWLYAMWPSMDAKEHPVGVIVQLTKAVSVLQNAAAINEALLVSALHQHELTAEAVKLNAQLEHEIVERKRVEAALHAANDRLGRHAGELEGIVAERTARLQDMVSELESFSYSIAHDMRAPLRGMEGFARILIADHTEGLDAVARTYLERIANSAARMDLLIKDVLAYTRVSRSESATASVDLDRLIRDVVANYPNWDPPFADIRIEGILPTVLGHTGFLAQCVANLIGNAIKFVATGVTPRVRIWAEECRPVPTGASLAGGRATLSGASAETPPWIRIWFEDNGIGIASKDRDRVFRMFERLNPADRFEGTGMGLTIVRKAIERMGGRVGFESTPSNGSRFWIELQTPAGTLPPPGPKGSGNENSADTPTRGE